VPWGTITVTYSSGIAVRTELVEVRSFMVRQAHHERACSRHRNSEMQY